MANPGAGRWRLMAMSRASSAIEACRVSRMLQPTVSHVVAIGSRPMANAGVHVDQRRKKEPAFAGPDVGQVREPYLVRRGRGEVPSQPVWGPRGSGNGPGDRFPEGRIIVAAVGRAHPTRNCGQSTQASKAHETRDTFVGRSFPRKDRFVRLTARRIDRRPAELHGREAHRNIHRFPRARSEYH